MNNFFTSVCKYLQLHKFSFLFKCGEMFGCCCHFLGVKKKRDLCWNIKLWNQKRPIYVAKGPENTLFFWGIVWSMRCIIQRRTREIRKRYTLMWTPKNVYSPRGRRLRFQLINSKFPAPLKMYLFPCSWQNKPLHCW